MAIVAIVSATALTILTASFNNTRAAMYKADAQYLVYDALECFKATGSADEFKAAFKSRGNVEELPVNVPQTGTNVGLLYKISDSQYTVEVSLVYNFHQNNMAPFDSFNIHVYDTEHKEIASTIYMRLLDYNEEEGAQ